MTYTTISGADPRIEIADVMRYFRPDFTEQDVSPTVLNMSTVDVDSWLSKLNIPLPVLGDISGFLTTAQLCFYIEYAGMTREAEAAYGNISQETMGKYTKRYDSGTPMFFFAQGSSDPFYALLSHESWRMRGFRLVEAYAKQWFKVSGVTGTNHNKYGAVAYDTTARGYGWNDDISDYDYELGEL